MQLFRDLTALVVLQALAYIEEAMPPETPVAFGLHPNAEIGFKLREGDRFCTQLQVCHGLGCSCVGEAADRLSALSSSLALCKSAEAPSSTRLLGPFQLPISIHPP